MLVPNQFPATDPGEVRIAVIGEAPGSSEVAKGIPFSGPSGFWLDRWLGLAGLDRSRLFVGNVCQEQPPGNDINRFEWGGPEVQSGIAALERDLGIYRPTFLIALGNTALHWARNGNTLPPWTPRGGHQWPEKVGNWRGSLFTTPAGIPALSTYHPAAALRMWELHYPIRLDLAKAKREAEHPAPLPVRTICIHTSFDAALAALNTLDTAAPLSFDIEGGCSGITSIAFATSPESADVFPLCDKDGNDLYTTDEETILWERIAQLLESPAPKVGQNISAYDCFVLAWVYGIHVANVAEDVMFKMWEWRCEMPKDLGTVASIFTRVPYYKSERLADTDEARWRYNGLDACVTLECCQRLEKSLNAAQLRDYRWRVRMSTVFLYMSLRGIRYDKAAAREEAKRVRSRVLTLQDEINRLAGLPVPTTPSEWFQIARERLCLAKPRRRWTENLFQDYQWKDGKWKKLGARYPGAARHLIVHTLPETPPPPASVSLSLGVFARSEPAEIKELEDLVTFAKESARETAAEVARELARSTPSTPLLSSLLGLSVNVNSTNAGGSCQTLLYTTWNLPPQYKFEEGKKTDKLTTDDDALLAIYAATQDKRVVKVLQLRRLLTELETLETESDPDGRIRCGYAVVGPKTGRTACYQSNTGSGYNLQTTTKKHRRFFLADPGHDLHQYDLSKADLYTVAAWCKKLGDSAMLDDLAAGIAPHALISVMRDLGPRVNLLSPPELKALVKKVDKESWIYFAGKKVVHMTNYLGQARTMSESIQKDSCKEIPEDLDSFAPLYVSPAECRRLQEKCYLARYWGVTAWHRHWEALIKDPGEFVSGCGHRRKFLGLRIREGGKVDRKTHGDGLAHEPQLNTTLATLLALWRLWTAAENREGDRLRVEPLHSVHDSLLVQSPSALRDWTTPFLRSCFNNPIPIAGQEITIPADGEIGTNWAMK